MDSAQAEKDKSNRSKKANCRFKTDRSETKRLLESPFPQIGA